MLRAISLRESWMREIRTSGLTRERAPNGPSLLYIFDRRSRKRFVIQENLGRNPHSLLSTTPDQEDEDEDEFEDEYD